MYDLIKQSIINNQKEIVYYVHLFDFKFSKLTYSNAVCSVHSNLTNGALLFSNACFHLSAHKHHESPGFKP